MGGPASSRVSQSNRKIAPSAERIPAAPNATTYYKLALTTASGLVRLRLERRIADASAAESASSVNVLDGNRHSKSWTLISWANQNTALSFEEIRGRGLVAVLKPSRPDNIRLVQTIRIKPHTNYTLRGWISTKGVVDAESPKSPRAAFVSIGAATSDSFIGTTDWTKVSVQFDSGENSSVEVLLSLGSDYHTCTGAAAFSGFTVTEEP